MKIKEDLNTVKKFKDYFCIRNKALHHQFKVDLAVNLTPSELAALQKEIEERGRAFIQDILRDAWNFTTGNVGREVVDGIKLAHENDVRDGRVSK